jgi:hypothetical protein
VDFILRVHSFLLVVFVAGCLGEPSSMNAMEELGSAKVREQTLSVTHVRIDGVPRHDRDGQYLEEGCIAVSRDGRNVLAGFHGRFMEFSPGYSSQDGGRTWNRLSFPPAGVSGDCAVAIMDDGSWVFLGSTILGATVLVSGNMGATWSMNALSALPLSGGWADRPWIMGYDGEIWMAYMPAYGAPGGITFTKSTDHGRNWALPRTIGEGLDGSTVKIGQLVRGGNEVFLPFTRTTTLAESMGAPAELLVAVTSDAGESWFVEKVPHEAHFDWPSMGITDSGHQVLAFTSARDGALTVVSRIGGTPWSQPTALHGGNGTRTMWPFLDGGHGSNVTWLVSSPNAVSEDLWLGRFDAASGESTKLVLGEGWIEFASVDHDANGTAYVSWSNWDDRWFAKVESLTGAGQLTDPFLS